MDLIKQKLLDMYYNAEDGHKVHGILPCQSRTKSCTNLASLCCANHMCKMCCQDLQICNTCMAHDSHDEFFRAKIRDMNQFENEKNFDRKKTLRLTFRKTIRRYELEKAFESYEIDWSKMEIYFNPMTLRMQYVYIVAANNEEARKILANKHLISHKFENSDVEVKALSNDINKTFEYFDEPENVCCVIKPESNLEVVYELPHSEELLKKLSALIQAILQLDYNQFTLEPDVNPITGEPDYNRLFVGLPNRTYVNRLYEAQPYFGALVCHKLTHVQICPKIRWSNTVC